MPPAYSKPFRQGHKNDFRDAHAVAEAAERPSTRCVPIKTDEQLDLQALHRVRSRLISNRTAVINQIRGFLLEHGIPVRQGHHFLRKQLPQLLAARADVLSPRMMRIIGDLMADWTYLDERIDRVTDEIEAKPLRQRERRMKRDREDAADSCAPLPRSADRASACRMQQDCERLGGRCQPGRRHVRNHSLTQLSHRGLPPFGPTETSVPAVEGNTLDHCSLPARQLLRRSRSVQFTFYRSEHLVPRCHRQRPCRAKVRPARSCLPSP